MLDREYELWECPPLSAWLSRERCATNRRRASEAVIPKSHVVLDDTASFAPRLQECVNCQGVEAWAKRTGKRPRSLSSAQLISSHVRAEARRRNLDIASSESRSAG